MANDGAIKEGMMATTSEVQFTQSGDALDMGAAVQVLIRANLRALNTAWLGEITKIDKNLVSVKQVIRAHRDEPFVVANNLMIGFPHSQIWRVQWKLKVGDIGLCVVCGRDLDLYKANGKSAIANTPRVKALQDSIFIPLSLYQSAQNDDTDFTIADTEGNEITFKDGALKVNANTSYALTSPKISEDCDNFALTASVDAKISAPKCDVEAQTAATITAPQIGLNGNISMGGGAGGGAGGGSKMSVKDGKISMSNDSTSLITLLQELGTLLETMASGQTSGRHTTAPNSIGSFSTWAAKCAGLFN